jgi:hypothetical protein
LRADEAIEESEDDRFNSVIWIPRCMRDEVSSDFNIAEGGSGDSEETAVSEAREATEVGEGGSEDAITGEG